MSDPPGNPTGFTARLPIKLLTPTALVLPVVLVVLLIGGVVYFQGRAAAGALEERGVTQIHGRIADRLNMLLDGPVRWHTLVRRNIEAGRLDPADLRSWTLPIYQQRHAFDPALAGVTWGDPQGNAFWVFRYPGNAFWELGIRDQASGGRLIEAPLDEDGRPDFDLGRESPDYDPRQRPWYRAGVTAGTTGTWGAPYPWAIGENGGAHTLGLPYAGAVHDADGQLLGVLDTELSLADLSAFLRSLQIGRTGLAVITDAGGSLIATSTNTPLATPNLIRLTAFESEHPDVFAMAVRVTEAYTDEIDHTAARWTGEVQLQNGPALMTVSRFKHGPGLDWRVMTAVPTADFTAEVDAIRARGLRIALVAVALTVLLGMGLAAWLARPMLRLRDHARQIGGGDLDTPLRLNQARELVELSDEFNHMTAGLRERLTMRRSLEMAGQVQQSLLPAADPDLPGFDIVGHCNYCDQTGGDYYDFLVDEHTAEAGGAIVIGDVMGHGIASAMLMATARGVLRSKSRDGVGIAELLTHLNRLLVEANGSGKFMTMLIVNLDPRTRRLVWASAGHDAPIIYRPETDTFSEPEGGGLPLGVMDEEAYTPAEPQPLPPGSVVLLATDGMWETRDPAGQMHGKNRLRDSIRRHARGTAAQIRDGLLADLHAFRGDAEQDDDETFVVIKSR
jgi:sigma-B regulation protein RsbU (phosphoserine phosphatase)